MLSLYRKEDIFRNSSFDFFDASNVTETEYNETVMEETKLEEYLEEVAIIS